MQRQTLASPFDLCEVIAHLGILVLIESEMNLPGAVEGDWRNTRERVYFDVTSSSASNARSRAIELKLIFITFFHVLPAAAMSHQI